MKIYPIVEGYGEVEAAPILLRRLLRAAECYSIEVGHPIRRTQAQLRHQKSVADAVALALLQPECAAILFLFDEEDTCPVERAQEVLAWARTAAHGTPCDVVVAHREYETWFLATVDSLRGKCGIDPAAEPPAIPEVHRDAKTALEAHMPPERAYSETGDQPALSAAFDLSLAHQRSRSFRKLVKATGGLLSQLNQTIPVWPPSGWQDAPPAA